MRPLHVIVVFDELGEQMLEVLLTQRNDVIQKLAPERPDESLDERILPRTMEGCRNLLDPAALEERRNSEAVDAIVVPVPGALAPDVGPALTRRA